GRELGSLLSFLVHVPCLAADVRFVNFYMAAQSLKKRAALHCQTDAMIHEPSGLLCDTQSARNLVRTNPVFAVHDHPDRSQPLVETKRGILKNCSGLERELSPLVLNLGVVTRTLPAVVLWLVKDILRTATRTRNAIRPAARYKVIMAVLAIREV